MTLVGAALIGLVVVIAGGYLVGRFTDPVAIEPTALSTTEALPLAGAGATADTNAPPGLSSAGPMPAVDRDGAPSGEGEMPDSRGDATPTADPPGYPDPIYTAEEAIASALAMLPEGVETQGIAARLLDYETAEAWLGSAYHGAHPHAPVWVVGVLTGDLTVADLLSVEGLPGLSGSGDLAGLGNEEEILRQEIGAPGLVFIFDANGGDMRTMTTLGDDSSTDLTSLSAMADMPLSIAPATLLPPLPTADATARAGQREPPDEY